MSFLGALTGFILVLAPTAPPVVTVEALAADPAKYDGKTLVVRADVSGTAVEGPKWVRLAVKGESGVVVAADLSRDKVTFVVPKDQKDKMVGGGVENEFRPMRLTVEVKRGERLGVWLAVVTSARAVDGPTSKGDTTPTPAGAKPAGDEASKGAGNRPKGTRTAPVGGDAKTALTVVIAEGAGVTPDGALSDALRNAVRQVVGAVVDAETLIENDDVVSDKVLTLSGGLVTKYDEVGRTRADGLHRVTIRAAVERGRVVAELKAAKVAVQEVDGKGLFAEMVTGLERAKDARALLGKKLRDYRAGVVRAEPVGKPKVKEAGGGEATVEFDVRVSADAAKYDALLKDMMPVLNRAAVAKGQVRMSATRQNDTGREVWCLDPDRRYPGTVSKTMAFDDKANGNTPGLSRLWQATDGSVWGEESGRRVAKHKGHHLIIACTERTRLDDRLTFQWFLVPKTDGGNCSVGIHVAVVDGQGREVTSDDIPLDPLDQPGLSSPGGDVTRSGDLILAPYVIHAHQSWMHWSDDRLLSDLTVRIAAKVAVAELKWVTGVRCTVEVKEDPKESGPPGRRPRNGSDYPIEECRMKRLFPALALAALAATPPLPAADPPAAGDDVEKACAKYVSMGPDVYAVKTDDTGRVVSFVVVGRSTVKTVLGRAKGLEMARDKARLDASGRMVRWLTERVSVRETSENETIIYSEAEQAGGKAAERVTGKEVEKTTKKMESVAQGLVRGLQMLHVQVDSTPDGETYSVVLGWDAKTAKATKGVEQANGPGTGDKPGKPTDKPGKPAGSTSATSPDAKKFLP